MSRWSDDHPQDWSSSDLVRGLRDNEQEAWREFYERFRSLFMALGREFGLSDADAGDLLQEAAFRVYQKLPEFERQRRGSFRTWLVRISTHLVIDISRKRAGGRRPSDLDEANDVPDASRLSPSEELSQEELAPIVEVIIGKATSAVKECAPESWEAYDLRVCQGRSAKEVSEILRVRVATVHMRVSRVRVQLLPREILQVLGRDYGDLASALLE